jgi:1-acyl-sn-glycerol-3-phosphate acyltransferase
MARHGRRVDREISRPSVFWLLGGIIRPVIAVFAKIEITGEENLPENGPFVLTPNHYSEIDPLVVAIAVYRLGRAPRFFAKESLFRAPLLGPAMKRAGMIPIARTSSSVSAKDTLDTAELLVKRGDGLVVYPEGTLTRDPDLWPMRGKTGAARIALAGDIPLIPVAQWGAQEILPRYGKMRFWPLRKRVQVVFGPPLDLSESRERAQQTAEQARVTGVLMDEIARLLEGLRGQKAPAQRWNPSEHGQKETGRLESES